jgi:hypothetical protein
VAGQPALKHLRRPSYHLPTVRSQIYRPTRSADGDAAGDAAAGQQIDPAAKRKLAGGSDPDNWIDRAAFQTRNSAVAAAETGRMQNLVFQELPPHLLRRVLLYMHTVLSVFCANAAGCCGLSRWTGNELPGELAIALSLMLPAL